MCRSQVPKLKSPRLLRKVTPYRKKVGKMCVVLQHDLGKGDAALSPCTPSRIGSSRASNPFQSQQTVSPVNHSRETSLSLHPSIRGLSCRPEPTRRTWRIASPPAPTHAQPNARLTSDQGSVPTSPDTPMTISSRPMKGAFALPFLGTIPPTNERSSSSEP